MDGKWKANMGDRWSEYEPQPTHWRPCAEHSAQPDEGNMTDLKSRLAEASGADRELDGDIALAFGLPQEFFGDGFKPGYVDGPNSCGPGRWAGGGKSYDAPDFTSSLDACRDLNERLFPGGEFDMTTLYGARVGINLNTGSPSYGSTENSDLCRAWLIAILSAKGQ
jgi:hypothetical protein